MVQLVVPLRELPLVQVHALNAQPFKRLARLADAHGAMPTASSRSLATRLGVGLQEDDNDSSETERERSRRVHRVVAERPSLRFLTPVTMASYIFTKHERRPQSRRRQRRKSGGNLVV